MINWIRFDSKRPKPMQTIIALYDMGDHFAAESAVYTNAIKDHACAWVPLEVEAIKDEYQPIDLSAFSIEKVYEDEEAQELINKLLMERKEVDHLFKMGMMTKDIVPDNTEFPFKVLVEILPHIFVGELLKTGANYEEKHTPVENKKSKHPYLKDGYYYTEDGERLYTRKDARSIINGTLRDAERGVSDPYDILPEDFA